jgi:hypothetical protein
VRSRDNLNDAIDTTGIHGDGQLRRGVAGLAEVFLVGGAAEECHWMSWIPWVLLGVVGFDCTEGIAGMWRAAKLEGGG